MGGSNDFWWSLDIPSKKNIQVVVVISLEYHFDLKRPFMVRWNRICHLSRVSFDMNHFDRFTFHCGFISILGNMFGAFYQRKVSNRRRFCCFISCFPGSCLLEKYDTSRRRDRKKTNIFTNFFLGESCWIFLVGLIFIVMQQYQGVKVTWLMASRFGPGWNSLNCR